MVRALEHQLELDTCRTGPMCYAAAAVPPHARMSAV